MGEGSMRGNHETDGGWSASRRTVLRSLGVGAGIATLGTAGSRAQGSSYWTVVALPDTQVYSERKAQYPRDQTQWIVDNCDSENIVFVSHEGDVVEHGEDGGEWEHMDDAMSLLDGTVPYSTVPGNHDWATVGDRSSSIENYKQYFGPSRYEGRNWFGGAGPSNGDPNRDDLNSYQLFSAGGYDFLHLALEWEPPGSVDDPSTPLGWAQWVLDQHPGKATILTTHSYLRDDTGSRAGVVQESSGDGNAAHTVWKTLVNPNPQVFMVLGGHWVRDDGEACQVSTNSAAQSVYQMVANYQTRSSGGHGLLRRIEFHPNGGSGGLDRIRMRTYSPTTDDFEDDDDSQFSFDLNFDERFRSFPSETEQVTFRQGVNGYNGTVSTGLREADPETSFGGAQVVTVDEDDPQGSENASQLLLRFDNIVGIRDGQVPPGASVQRAVLTVETVDGGDGATVNRMLVDWTGEDTWDSMNDGVQTDGTDAASEAVTKTGPVVKGPTTLDISASVQRWANDLLTKNHGWVFCSLGDDGWDIATAESDTSPTLRVWYVPPETPVGDADGDGDVDGEDVTHIQQYIAGKDDGIDKDAADADTDGDVDVGDAVLVRNLSEDDA